MIKYNKKTDECEIDVEKGGKVTSFYYPCIKFITKRLELFENSDIGAFVWEAGQGLEYFYELF